MLSARSPRSRPATCAAEPAPAALVYVTDTAVLDQVLRSAAAAGCPTTQVDNATAARAAWTRASLIVMDAAAARCGADAGFPRRDGVVVASTDPPDDRLWRSALVLGARRVAMLPAEQVSLSEAFADAAEEPAAGGGAVVAVAGGCGGAGSSVLAGAVAAVSARRGRDALLVDCDPAGGGLDRTVGMESERGMRWPELRLADGRVTASSLRAALPTRALCRGDVTVLACSSDGTEPGAQAVGTVVEAGFRAGSTVVCDLSRCQGPPVAAALQRADLVVLVVTAEVRACAAAKCTVAAARAAGASMQAVVRGPSPGGLRPSEVCAELGVPLLLAMRPDPAVPALVDGGRLLERRRGHLVDAARVVLAAAAEPRDAAVAA